MPAVLHRVFLDRDAVGHAVVGHLQCRRVAHVDFVLAWADLVVAVLDMDPELLQCEHRLAAHVGAGVKRRQVEVAALVENLGAVGILEEEVLELGPDVEGVKTHPFHPCDRTSQHLARVALVGSPFGRLDVAEHARHALLFGTPRKDGEGRRIGHRDHVRLLNRVEAGDRRTVEAHPALERVVELVDSNRERLQLTEDVGEPKADEADVALGAERLYVIRACRLICHTATVAPRKRKMRSG
uniref:Unannotated protein n=1 Tax=freshwater metagenome TaxID=449393 RepID=A0A6J5ZZ65_9ZZZZ